MVGGPLHLIELGSIDSKNFVPKRIRWYTNGESIAKDLASWNAQMPCRICENEEDLVQVKLIMEVVKGDMLEDGTVSELDLELAGLIPSEPVFPFAQKSAGHLEMN